MLQDVEQYHFVVSFISLACHHALVCVVSRIRDLFSKLVSHLMQGHLNLLLDSLGTTVASVVATTSSYSTHSHVATKQTQAHHVSHNTGHFCLSAASHTSLRTVFKTLTPMNYKTVQERHVFSSLSDAASFPSTAKPQSRSCSNEPGRRTGQTAM